MSTLRNYSGALHACKKNMCINDDVFVGLVLGVCTDWCTAQVPAAGVNYEKFALKKWYAAIQT